MSESPEELKPAFSTQRCPGTKGQNGNAPGLNDRRLMGAGRYGFFSNFNDAELMQ